MIKSGFSLIKIKSINEEKRIISGIASTPHLDRQGDIVDPKGVKFETMPKLMLYHDSTKPVGNLTVVDVTKDGIVFEAQIPNVTEDGVIKDRVDEAWHSLKYNLISAVSIGFRTLEHEVLKSGGWLIKSWEWLELSLVPIPAQPNAIITGIKAFDEQIRASMGDKKDLDIKEKSSTVDSEKKTKSVIVKINKQQNKENKEMKITAQLKQFRSTLAEKQTKLVELGEKSADETFSAEDKEMFDTLASEVEEVKSHIERLEVAEKADISSVKAVSEDDGKSEDKAKSARNYATTTVKSAVEAVPGLAFARLAKCKALSHINHVPAYEFAEKYYAEDHRLSKILRKAAVAAGNTTDSTWAAPLIPEETSVYADFAAVLRPETILGKFGTNGIPSLMRVPFRTRLISQTSGGAANWVGEAKPKGLTKFDFAGTSLDPLKIADIAVITKELLMDSSPSAEMLVRDGLRDALVAKLDHDFIDPTVAASAGVSPASVTNAVVPVPSGGGVDADAVRADVRALMATFIAANNPPKKGVFVMDTLTALALSMMQNGLGQAEFPGITMNGGTFVGYPVIVSDYVTAGYVFLVNADDIYYGDGEITVDMSTQASLQMDSSPDSPATASTVMVSLWQNNLVGFLVEKRVNWSKRRASAVAVLSGVNWGAEAS